MSTLPGRELCTREVIHSQHQWVRGQSLCLHGEGSGQMWSLARKLGLPGTQGESKAVSCCRSWRFCQKYGGSHEAPKEDGLTQGSAPPPHPGMFVPTRGRGGDQNVILFSEYKWVLALILASFIQKNIRAGFTSGSEQDRVPCRRQDGQCIQPVQLCRAVCKARHTWPHPEGSLRICW